MRQELLVKAKVGGGPPTGERRQSWRPFVSLSTSPLRRPNTQEPTREGARPHLRAVAWRLTASPGHPTLPPRADLARGERKPLTSERHPALRDAGLLRPSRDLARGSQNWGKVAGEVRQGRRRESLAKGWRCARERAPVSPPSDSASAPAPGLLRGATSTRTIGVELGSMGWRLWGFRGRLSCADFTHDPAPTAAKPSARKGAEPQSPPCTLLCPGVGGSSPQEEQGWRGCGGWRGEGARGCAEAALGSLITSACSAPAPSS